MKNTDNDFFVLEKMFSKYLQRLLELEKKQKQMISSFCEKNTDKKVTCLLKKFNGKTE